MENIRWGIFFLIGFTLCYMTAVSWADYSYVMPAGAFGYAVQTVLAPPILHEVVNTQRWIGVVLIVTGVLLVGQDVSEHHGTEGGGDAVIKVGVMLVFLIC